MDRRRRNQSIAFGLLAFGLLVGLLGLFLTWWSVALDVTGDEGELRAFDFRARPFSSKSQEHPLSEGEIASLKLDQALDRHVVTVGILASVTLTVLAAAVGLGLLGNFSLALPGLPHLLLLGAIVGLGLVSALLAPVQWPEAWDRHLKSHVPDDDVNWTSEFWGSDRLGESPDGHSDLSYSPGWGWFLFLTGTVVFPGIAASTRWWPTEPKQEQVRPDFAPPPVAPAPGLPIQAAKADRMSKQKLELGDKRLVAPMRKKPGS